MGLKGVLTHSMSHKQHILLKSNIATMLFFVLFTTVTLSFITRQLV